MKGANNLKQFLKDYRYTSTLEVLDVIDYKKLASQFGEKEKSISLVEEEELCKNIKIEIQKNGGDFSKLGGLLSKIPYIIFSKHFDGDNKTFYRSHLFQNFLDILVRKNKFNVLKRTLNEILFHQQTFDDYDWKNIDQTKRIFKEGDSRAAKKVIRSNEKFHFLDHNGLEELSKRVLKAGFPLFHHHSDPDWPIKGRLLSGGLGKQFIKHISENLKNEKDLELFINYINLLKKWINVESSIIQRICILVDELGKSSDVTNEGFNTLKSSVEKIADDFLGDPRFNPSAWHSIITAKEIIIRWKIEKSIKNFFSLLDYISRTDRDVKRMWPHRKNFIKAYFDKGYIHGAWFILGKKAYNLREKFLVENSENSFGKLLKGGNLKHSVFLFEIGSLILSEWSYNGSVRVWKKSSKDSPKLYQKEYSRADVVFKNNKKFNQGEIASIRHQPPHRNWQRRLADIIYDHTNINLRWDF